jgi:hypothetical protein
MFKKLNTTHLIIILVVLAGLVIFSKLYKNRQDESTFRNIFVAIDSASVNSISIYPKVEKGKEIRLIKNGNGWDLQNEKIKTVADSNAVRGLIGMFTSMKSLSLAGQDRSSWNDLQVGDTSGTRIKISAGSQEYDMVVGKFGYNQATRSGLTYIRHKNEEAVYAVEGFLSFTVNQGFNSWRVKTFIQGNKDSWTTLTFTYPGDSSFALSRSGNEWLVNGERTDSAKTAQFINSLSNIPANGFIDSYSPASTPLYTLTIAGNGQQINVWAYPSDSIQKFVLHSSLNKDAWLSESESHLAARIFVGKNHFLPETAGTKN